MSTIFLTRPSPNCDKLGCMEGHIGKIAHVHLTDELKAIADRQIAEGRAASEADYLEEAIRR